MNIQEKRKVLRKDIFRILLIIVASVIMSINLNSFVDAGGLLPGGFTGLTILIQEITKEFLGFKVSFAFVNILLNSIPVFVSYKCIGKKFTIFSCIMIILTSIFTDIIPSYPITYDILLISIFGGMVSGTAISMCLFADATSGGTDFIAIFLSKRYGIDAWNYILIGNAVILLVAGYLFGWNKALYSIIFQFTSTQMLHLCYKRYKKNTLFIITQYPEEVAKAISETTRHASTTFHGFGTYEKKERTLIYSVVGREEVKKVVSNIREVDDKVFINIIKTEQLEGNFYIKPND
ncbi:YitT family protein [Candidatus Galacturonibacter soehngenii]|uniref:YitT family protein n=1 Tax=Candidatus Galacturonatibacter soehngenii TaxID=2307010 RepID=A0A7V7QNG7_9FIRM|nr:YitT family protein [Candidatus Galacturonibacter soehngenii]KAB1440145.1 YitT family protein [Candidatus Galacturonibacter soehngenii]